MSFPQVFGGVIHRVWISGVEKFFGGDGFLFGDIDEWGSVLFCMQVDVTSLLVQRSNQESTQKRGRRLLRNR